MDILHVNVGIDVSKDTLDIAILNPHEKVRTFQVANIPEGFTRMIYELERISNPSTWRVALEATSAYHRAVVTALKEQGVMVLVLNPKQARDLARGLGILRKNDRTDATVLAKCSKMAWREPEAIAQGVGYELQEISRRIEVLTNLRAAERKRLLKPGVGKIMQDSFRRQISLLDMEIHLLEKAWCELLEAASDLKLAYTNIRTVPGCGQVTARKVVSEMLVAPRKRTTGQCVAYAGLAPQEQTSGIALRRRSQTFTTGNKLLRTALYMGAVSSLRNDVASRDLYLRLIESGKPKKVAIVAVMAKLMRRIAAVANRGTPWVNS